jgi:hypothetical protein
MDAFWQGKGVILSTSIHEGHPLNIMEGAVRGLRPVVHNFYGAKEIYPPDWLFNTVEEAVYNIMHDHGTMAPGNYVEHIRNSGWTLDNQVSQLKALVDKLGRKGK